MSINQEGATAKDLAEALQSLERLADVGMAEGKKLGADATKIATSARTERRLVVETGEFTLANTLASRSIGIGVHKDKKKGSASINSADDAAVRAAVADAAALASYSVPDEYICFATSEEAPRAKPLGFLFDPALAEVELETMHGMMREMLAVLVRDPRVALERFEMGIDVSAHGTYNSHGVRQTERQTMVSWSFMGMAREGDEVTGFDYDGGSSFSLENALPKALDEAERFAKKLVSFLKPRKCPSYKGPVLFTPRAVQELVTGMILYHASGRQVMDGKSLWGDAIGRSVTSPLISLVDQPHDPRFSGATAFDGDGVPTRKNPILEKGVLVSHLHDCYSARRLSAQGKSAKTTGTAGGPFALTFAEGTTPVKDLYKGAKNLLVIDRFSGNTDPVKGDFSGVAKSSRLYVDGVDAGAVTETMIAGNFFEMAKAVLAVGNVAEMIGSGFASPAMLFDGLSVTGQG